MKEEREEETQTRITSKFLAEQCFENLLCLMEKISPNKDTHKILIMPKDFKYLLYLISDLDQLKMRHISADFFPFEKNIHWEDLDIDLMIMIVPPDTKLLNNLIEWGQRFKRNNPERQVHVVFMPQRTFMIKYDLSNIPAASKTIDRIHDFNFDLIPLADDLLSLQYKQSLREMFVGREYNCHNMAAESLFRLETVFGNFKSVLVKGTHAKIVNDIKQSMMLDNEKRFKQICRRKMMVTDRRLHRCRHHR